MPWTYGADGVRLARDLFRLRYRLIPYIYTMSAETHRESGPARTVPLPDAPRRERAYGIRMSTFGDAMLVAPIVDSSGIRDVYLPPGEWVELLFGCPASGRDNDPRHMFAGDCRVRPCQDPSFRTRPNEDYVESQKPADSLLVTVLAPGDARLLRSTKTMAPPWGMEPR